MKIGNVSQTIVPVPDFYLNQNDKKLETFNIPSKNRSNSTKYFRERDFFKKLIDINLNHNPRYNIEKYNRQNQQKYIPIYNRGEFPSNVENKKTIFPDIIDTSKGKTIYPTNGYEKYKDYMRKTDVNEQIEPKLRKELMYNTIQLLERINADYDLKKWDEFDTRVNFNRFYQTAYSPITDYLNTHKPTKEVFMQTLSDKAKSLTTVNSRARENIELVQRRKEEEQKMRCINQANIDRQLDEVLDKNKEGLLRLKYNNKTPFNFNEADEKLLKENFMYTYMTQDTNLYKELPSPGRMEFDSKKVKPIRKKYKASEDVPGMITKDKYNFNENEIYNCQDEMWIRPLHKDHL